MSCLNAVLSWYITFLYSIWLYLLNGLGVLWTQSTWSLGNQHVTLTCVVFFIALSYSGRVPAETMLCLIMVGELKHFITLSETFHKLDQQQYHLKLTNAQTMNRYKLSLESLLLILLLWCNCKYLIIYSLEQHVG